MIASRHCRRTRRWRWSTWRGNSDLRERLHRHFGDGMKYSGRIGLTPSRFVGQEPELPGAKPSWFFAPDQIRKRAKEWGPGGIDTRFSAAWSGFAPHLDHWLTVIEAADRRAVKQVYVETLAGRNSAAAGPHAVCWLSNRLSVRSRTV